MPEKLPHIIPAPQPEISEAFAAYKATSQFYQEVQSRAAMSRYCDWYYTTAERHRQELQQIRSEINILSWFRLFRRY